MTTMKQVFFCFLFIPVIFANCGNRDPDKIEVRTASFEDYNITIPKDWNYIHKPDSAAFVSKDNRYSLTINVNPYDKNKSSEELSKLFQKFLDIRLEAEKTATNNDIELTPVKINKANHHIYSRFNGYEITPKRFFECLMTAEKGKLVTVYIESFTDDQEYFLNLSGKIINSLEIK